MELGPISASLGAMGSLAWKLDELLATRHRALRGVVMDVIEELRTDLHILHNLLLKLSNEQDPPPMARYWMKDVRDLSYDMEDCADQFVHADACAKIRRANRRKIITRLKINRLPERRKWRPWITNKVSEFRTRAQEAIQRYWRYKFDYCASNPGYSRVGHELPTLYTEPGDLVGMEGPMNELDRWLTNGEEQLKVVSIVGVGGVGKTTLAQKLWGKLQGQFDCRAFVRTAQKPDMRGILRSILSQVRRHQLPGPGEMHHLIHELRQYLQAKRYFVIIDDLWATSVWDVVSRAFPEGNCCSRIITTTEIMEVALACCGYCHEHIFKMEPLSDDDSEKLLLQRILVSGNQNPQNFNDVVSQITRKCGGLPLAIIIVGSLLASQPDLDQWGFAQNSFGSYLRANPTMEGFMGQILNISFNSLPHYLKTCLLYLSTYPEGYIFLKDHLVKQWVAESFICAKEGEDIEEVAGSYFDELVSTGLIQVDINYNYELSSYSVHHMVLDLITYKSIEENFITIVDYSQTTTPLADKVRRLSLHFGSATYATIPASTRLSQVRTLFFFGLFNCMPSFVVFKLLRVLNLHFWGDLENTSFNLTEICELFQLRYLQVTCNVTVKLPDKIEAMKHLETLEINARVCAVPPDIVRLSSLLHLCLGGGTNLPDGIGCMRSLRTLKYFDLGNNSEDNLRGLGELTNLRDLHLTYSTLPSSEHLKRNLIALASSLGKLGNLKSLTLTPGTAGTVVLIDGLDGMSNLVFLERLELLPPICIFSILPIWFAQLDKICIMKVAVRELRRDDIDILSGLPSLTVLSLCVQTAPEGRIVFNDGAFPVLKYFKFSCGVLCMSFMSGAMPNLRRLKLCFNTHIGEKYSNMLAGIEHLLHLQDITGRIGAATESDRRAAESAIKDVISKHPRCPRFNVQRVDPVEEEHGRQEKGSSGEKHGVLEKAEDTNKHEDSRLSQLPDLPSAVASHRLKSERTAEASKHHVLESMLSDESAEPKRLELSLLEDITNNFSVDQEIGRSGFGVVYKGKLPNGSIVVVKRLAIAIDDKLFLDGVDCLMTVKHSNIVRFLGYYANMQENVIKEGGKSVSGMMRERLLCFEYLCNGNLQMHLTDESCGFDWRMCYQIIKGICQGLQYLHDNRITHLDLKPDNILFDDKMVPKIVDYGYSRLFSEEISRTVLTGGSLAYMATPEYLGGGAITHKSDIYSLGVIIMQIVTGQNKKDCSNISGVLESWRSRLESDASHGHTSLETCYQQVKVCVEIGISCMDHDPWNRSITREIIRRLDKTEITEQPVSLSRFLMRSGEEARLNEFQWHVAACLAELRDGEGFLSMLWVRRLLELFLLCQEEFRFMAAQVRRPVAAEMIVAGFHIRAVKMLDVCNAARYGIDQVRWWGRLASIAASVLLVPGDIHKGQLRRARKALSKLLVLLVNDDAAAAATGGGGSVASFLASHRNRSLPCSVYHTWSAAQQLQDIGDSLVPLQAREAGLATPEYTMGCMLHLAAWALVAAVPCPDRGAALQAHHLPTAAPRAAFPWVSTLLTLQDRLAKEGKRKDRHNSCSLLMEIHVLKKRAQRLAEAIDAALAGKREAMVQKAAAELAAMCTAMKDGLKPLERQVQEVFHHIMRSRMEVLDSQLLRADLTIKNLHSDRASRHEGQARAAGKEGPGGIPTHRAQPDGKLRFADLTIKNHAMWW